MDPLARFLDYAQDFEKTYADDDWSRLDRHFAPDAVYLVGPDPFTCRLEGRPAIFRGIKKSVDNFDRRFAERTADLSSPPELDGDRVSVEWEVAYRREGAPPMVLNGRSTATVRGGVITELADELKPSPEALAWLGQYGGDLDASYA